MSRIMFRPNLRSRRMDAAILLFNTALIGIIWFSVIGVTQTDRQDTIRAAVERNDNLAIALEEYTTRTIESADAIIRYLIRERARTGSSFNLQEFIEKYTIDNTTLTGVVLADESGNVATTTLNLSSAKPVNVSDREHFSVHRGAILGGVFVGKPVTGRITGKMIVPITRRINKPDGSFGGVAMALVEHIHFTDILKDAKMRPLDIISVIGLDGITRARLSGPKASAGEDISKSPLFIEQKRNAIGSYFAPGQLDGIKRHFSYRTLPEYRLIVTVGTAESDVLAQYAERRNRYFSAAGIASVVIAVFTVLLLLALAVRRKAAIETARSQSRFLATFNQAAVGIAHADIHGRFIDVNDKFCSILGYSREELLQRTSSQVTHPEDVAASHEFRRRLTADPDNAANTFSEKRYIRKDGSIIWCLRTAAIVRDENGRIDYFASVIQDISERKRNEQMLRDYANRMRELSRRLGEVEESERRNIHRELHDQVGANLSALKLDLGLIANTLPDGTDPAVADRLNRAQQLAGETISRIRNVMADLRPPALDDYGLLSALRTHAAPYAERLGIPVSVSGNTPEPRPPALVETALFRIAQEALNNIAKHARAHFVHISLQSSPGQTVLGITDDGAGFEATGSDGAHGRWGLRTMRERALSIGAELQIESAPGQGTRITVTARWEAAP